MPDERPEDRSETYTAALGLFLAQIDGAVMAKRSMISLSPHTVEQVLAALDAKDQAPEGIEVAIIGTEGFSRDIAERIIGLERRVKLLINAVGFSDD